MGIIDNENVAGERIRENEAGIVLAADGSFRIFNTYEKIDGDNLTEIQKAHGETLIALAMVCKVPEVRQMVLDIVANSEAFADDKVVELRPHS